MIVQSHPTVNTFNRALAEALYERGALHRFHTTLSFGRRSLALPRRLVKNHPWPEIARLALERTRWRSAAIRYHSPFGPDAVYRGLDRTTARQLKGAAGAYCYEDGALKTFEAARKFALPV